MKRVWFFLSVIVLVVTIGGCARSPTGNPIVFTETRLLGPAGGHIASDAYQVGVTFGAGALLAESPVTLTVFEEQFAEIDKDGYLHSAHGVRLSFDPGAVAPDEAILIEIGHRGDYDSFGTMLAVMREDGVLMALPSHSSGPGQVSGELQKSLLDILFAEAPQGAQQALTVFSANRLLNVAADPLTTSVRPFVNGSFSGQVPDLTGQRVAVVVHGIDSSLADLTTLGQFLLDFRQAGQSSPYYEVVIGFEYSSNAELAEIGTAMADDLEEVGLESARAVDLFAHSMGNLVSRYAMETSELPNRIANVDHYVSLGGPHAGVPFGDLRYLEQAFFYWFHPASEPCLRDLLTNGKDGEPQTVFLKNLNLAEGQQGPNFLSTHYFTMSGNNYSGLEPPVGDAIHLLYLASVGLDVQDDGVVANDSAQSPVLSRQSQSWTANPPLDLTHEGLHTSPEAFNQMASWMNSWP